MKLRPDHAFLQRAATRERALLMAHIGHPTGVMASANDNSPGAA